MTPSDIQYRDLRASQILGLVSGHTAVGLVRSEIRKVFDGWMYWGTESMVFFADSPIFNGSRELLLDYSKVEHPMLKDFPVEGFSEVFYDFFEDQVVFSNNEVLPKVVLL
jgi:hypothetical protein